MPRFSRSAIAVVEVYGVLGPGVRPSVYYPVLERVERSARIAALVVDIDSPGGSVSASEELYRKLLRIRERKPIVAYIRGSGTSGAYLLASAASRVVALPGALVGSIGVISFRPMAAELLSRLGIEVSVNKSAPLKDMGAFYRTATAEEQRKFQGLIDELADTFVRQVAQARNRDVTEVRGWATGEVFTASQGREMGLVDELGDFDTALDAAASLGGVRRRPVYIRPRRTFRDRVMGRFPMGALAALQEGAGDLLSPRLWYL